MNCRKPKLLRNANMTIQRLVLSEKVSTLTRLSTGERYSYLGDLSAPIISL